MATRSRRKILSSLLVKKPTLETRSVYEDALFYELRLRNIPALSQVQIPVTYKNFKLRDPMRLDILVDNKVVIEGTSHRWMGESC